MTILIKGMDMPANCSECRLVDVEYCFCHAVKITNIYDDDADAGNYNFRPIWCPLVEVPTPHGDLIDREELLNNTGGVYTARPGEAQKIQHEINKVLFAIQDAPTVIEAEGE